ncbi:hypothetical protein D6D10_10501, partial [Aureobasidium pullulans]
LLSRRRGANPGRGIIDPRRVSGGSSRHDVAIKSGRGKTVHEIRHRKNIAIDMLLMINESTWKETALYYYPTIFARGDIFRDVRREKDMEVFISKFTKTS